AATRNASPIRWSGGLSFDLPAPLGPVAQDNESRAGEIVSRNLTHAEPQMRLERALIVFPDEEDCLAARKRRLKLRVQRRQDSKAARVLGDAYRTVHIRIGTPRPGLQHSLHRRSLIKSSLRRQKSAEQPLRLVGRDDDRLPA